jgi:hypothetical protein
MLKRLKGGTDYRFSAVYKYRFYGNYLIIYFYFLLSRYLLSIQLIIISNSRPSHPIRSSKKEHEASQQI